LINHAVVQETRFLISLIARISLITKKTNYQKNKTKPECQLIQVLYDIAFRNEDTRKFVCFYAKFDEEVDSYREL
jgi:hypothetical protein